MVNNCSAYGCSNEYNPQKPITFFGFPFKRPEILEKWVKVILRENWYPSKSSKICGQHFTESDYQIRPGCIVKLLKPDAVPSIFSIPKPAVRNNPNAKILKKPVRQVRFKKDDILWQSRKISPTGRLLVTPLPKPRFSYLPQNDFAAASEYPASKRKKRKPATSESATENIASTHQPSTSCASIGNIVFTGDIYQVDLVKIENDMPVTECRLTDPLEPVSVKEEIFEVFETDLSSIKEECTSYEADLVIKQESMVDTDYCDENFKHDNTVDSQFPNYDHYGSRKTETEDPKTMVMKKDEENVFDKEHTYVHIG